VLRLELRGSEPGPRAQEFEADVVRIGRAESCDVVVSAVHVSGEHAAIVWDGAAYVLRDLRSTNGTRVRRDGTVIALDDTCGRELALRDGDVISLGQRDGAAEIGVSVRLDELEGVVRAFPVSEIPDVEEKLVRSEREVLRLLYEAQKAISAADSLEGVVDAVSAQVFRALPRATHLTVAMRDEAADGAKAAPYTPVATRVRGGYSFEVTAVARSVFRKVIAERSAVLAADARQDMDQSASLVSASIVSLMAVPLWQGDDILGVLQVDNRDAPGMFDEADLDRLALLAQSASQAFARARALERLREALERQRSENVFLKAREERRHASGILGESAAMKALFTKIDKVVDTRVTVLILGETGTGKELVASAVHYRSSRRDKLFVAQNCAALPENLLESELFGYRKGAFTGAREDKKGLFELADGGTLFLDELGEMPLSLQAKMLRVIQEGEVRPVGATSSRKVDVRIVAATNRDLEREVAEGRFREDLYYRVSVFPIELPPLRERRGDVQILARHFLERYAAEFGRAVRGFTAEALERLAAYPFPGNVRELENEVQRLVIQVDDREVVELSDLSARIRAASSERRPVAEGEPPNGDGTLKERVEAVEMRILEEALALHGGNKSATAKALGITREGLHKKLKGYGMA
jgi:transcriptional regulator with GAF, ATPase, and Fis domain